MKKQNIINHFFLITFTLLCIFTFNIDSRALNEKANLNVTSLFAEVTKEKIVYLGNTPDPECKAILTEDVINLLQDVFDVIKFADVILVLALTIVTFTQAVAKGGDELKKALNITIKRIIIGVIIFFIPILIDFVFDAIGLYNTCGIG